LLEIAADSRDKLGDGALAIRSTWAVLEWGVVATGVRDEDIEGHGLCARFVRIIFQHRD
jgi:hypothetical protein